MPNLKMLAAGATEGPLSELLPEFTRAGGAMVDVEFGTVGLLRDRFVGGEAPDVIALSAVVLEALEKEGRFVSGSRVTFGQATCGVAIRDGFLVPNIATPEAFKKALLNARSVAQTDPAQGGSSGIYFAKLLERMGIAEQMKDKLIYGKAGRHAGPQSPGRAWRDVHQRVHPDRGPAGGGQLPQGIRICERLWCRHSRRRAGRAGAGLAEFPHRPGSQGAI
jgi:molybdate transport system substrate-binding protein